MEPIYKLYSSLTELEQRKTWAEIDLDALRQNYRLVRQITSNAELPPRIIAVVKAEAYGHGAPACVRTLLSEGCDFFAVASFEEALAVRRVCDENQSNAAVLILGYTHPLHAKGLAAHKLTQALLSADYAQALQKAAEAAEVIYIFAPLKIVLLNTANRESRV